MFDNLVVYKLNVLQERYLFNVIVYVNFVN